MDDIWTLAGDTDDGAFSWQEQALCAQTDPEAFFPEKRRLNPRSKKGLPRMHREDRVLDLRIGQRRTLRDLGWPVRAGAPQAKARRGLAC